MVSPEVDALEVAVAVRGVVLALLVGVATCWHAPEVGATEYRVTRLPLSFPVAMNDWGTVVGEGVAEAGPSPGAFVWKHRSLTPVPGLQDYPDAHVTDINDLGVVVGTAYNQAGRMHDSGRDAASLLRSLTRTSRASISSFGVLRRASRAGRVC
jgi:hypothetical protein